MSWFVYTLKAINPERDGGMRGEERRGERERERDGGMREREREEETERKKE